jgi:hypothetical protein
MIAITENSFTCVKCGQTKPIQTEGGTGYGVDSQKNKICYDCCAILDREQMIQQGRTTLYLVKRYYDEANKQWRSEPVNASEKNPAFRYFVTNWPGTLSFKCHCSRMGNHNIASERIDVWFRDKSIGAWHGVHYGRSSDLVYCKRLNEG